MKKILIHIRTWMKFLSLVAISVVLIVAAIILIYKPTYSVTLNGEFVGYTNDKSGLQDKINEYIKAGDGEHIAFVQVDTLPEYSLCLLKKDTTTNDEEIIEKIKSSGTIYYKYYAITESAVEKLYVSNKEEAEKVIEDLKEKNSENKDTIAYVEKYGLEIAEITDTETAVTKLYKEPAKVTNLDSVENNVRIAKKANLGISLIRPVGGTITSRYGTRGRGNHTGLDIATNKGTPIKAAAGGTVTYSGRKGTYGNLIIISHGNGVQTYYAHCDALYVSTGTQVSQGDIIAAVGSTGNSSGPHLHLEIRVNGTTQNPQNYLY